MNPDNKDPDSVGRKNPDGKGEEKPPEGPGNNDPSTFGRFAPEQHNIDLKQKVDNQAKKDLHGDMNPPDFKPPPHFQHGPGRGGHGGGGPSSFGGIGPSF
uniref:Uncharacterized protein n=1 Tax=Panagrolaimus sp. ES5 TaxID=591445 RepID=A0AC34GP98_9BILA